MISVCLSGLRSRRIDRLRLLTPESKSDDSDSRLRCRNSKSPDSDSRLRSRILKYGDDSERLRTRFFKWPTPTPDSGVGLTNNSDSGVAVSIQPTRKELLHPLTAMKASVFIPIPVDRGTHFCSWSRPFCHLCGWLALKKRTYFARFNQSSFKLLCCSFKFIKSSPKPTTVGSIQHLKNDGDGHADIQTDGSTYKVTYRTLNQQGQQP